MFYGSNYAGIVVAVIVMKRPGSSVDLKLWGPGSSVNSSKPYVFFTCKMGIVKGPFRVIVRVK